VSIKGATGQPFSAGGPLQVAAALCAIKTGVIPPTAHFSTADEGDPFDHVCAARKAEVPLRHVLVLSYGYGGGKAALILSACGESR
jgi:minimal PKS chain-length factor (CLF/KS beta)